MLLSNQSASTCRFSASAYFQPLTITIDEINKKFNDFLFAGTAWQKMLIHSSNRCRRILRKLYVTLMKLIRLSTRMIRYTLDLEITGNFTLSKAWILLNLFFFPFRYLRSYEFWTSTRMPCNGLKITQNKFASLWRMFQSNIKWRKRNMSDLYEWCSSSEMCFMSYIKYTTSQSNKVSALPTPWVVLEELIQVYINLVVYFSNLFVLSHEMEKSN